MFSVISVRLSFCLFTGGIPVQGPSHPSFLDMLELFELGPHGTTLHPHPDIFKLEHYEVRAVRKRPVGIQLALVPTVAVTELGPMRSHFVRLLFEFYFSNWSTK